MPSAEPLDPSILARFDPADPAFIADPYPVLRELRQATPIFWYEPAKQWMLTRYSSIHAALRDRRLGRAYHHRFSPEELGLEPEYTSWPRFAETERWSLLNLEPPDHTRIRVLISKVFTPSSINALRPLIEHESSSRLARLAARSQFDLLADYAQPFSVAVICAMLGVPANDTPLLLRWSHDIVKMYELDAAPGSAENAELAAGEFIDYVHTLIAAKRAHPDAALVSQLIAVEEQGDRLTVDEILSTIIVLLNAGHEATVNTLGNGMRAFMRHRHEWTRVTSGEVATRPAVEEMIRWDPPLHLFDRWVLEHDVEIAGQSIARGEMVAMLFGSANRDPEHFPDADRFDAGRGDASHVGFGGGIHFCIGAPLARLELDASLTQLVRQFPDLELAEEPEYHPTFVIRGLQRLLLEIR